MYIELLSAEAQLTFNSIAYATNTTLILDYPTVNNRIMRWTSFLAATVTTMRKGIFDVVTGAGDTQIIENEGITISVLTGNPTAGDSNIKIYATYKKKLINSLT